MAQNRNCQQILSSYGKLDITSEKNLTLRVKEFAVRAKIMN
jgi:hypothetical protein